MSGGSINDPLEIIDDPTEYIRKNAERAHNVQYPSPPTSSHRSVSKDSSATPPANSNSRTSLPQAHRALPPGFRPSNNGTLPGAPAHNGVQSPNNAESSSSAQNHERPKSGSASAATNGRVWNPPPRPWEKEARAKAAQTIATLQQSDDSIPTISGSGARAPNRFLDAQGQLQRDQQQDVAIDLTGDDDDDDDEPRIVSFRKGDIELNEQKNNEPVCIGTVSAIVLCMHGLPEPIASSSPAVQDPNHDHDPLWDRSAWPGASRWFVQPGYRPVIVKVKYPMASQSLSHQRAEGTWSYGGNRPPQQGEKPELAVSVVLSPRAHAAKQAREGVSSQNLSYVPFYNMPFGGLADKFVEALGPLLWRNVVHAESRCRMVSPARAGHFLHSVEMLLFCTRSNVSFVAEQLSRHGVMLEPPRPEQFNSADYSSSPALVNPHGLGSAAQANALANRSRFASSMYTSGLGTSRMVQSKEMTEEERKKQIEMVYDQLVAGEDLPLAEPSPLIKTQLFPHQLKAISFLLDREKERTFDDAQDTAKADSKDDTSSAENAVSLWKVVRSRVDGSIRTYHNVVTHLQQSEQPEICRGAILADDMGLGKTITVIATIAATVKEARDFQRGKLVRTVGGSTTEEQQDSEEEDDDDSFSMAMGLHAGPSKKHKASSSRPKPKSKKGGKRVEQQKSAEAKRRENLVTRTKATLIVCPLSIVSNWEEQIKEHWVSDKQPSIYIYHGPSRSSIAQVVAGYDIVMTTYATLASEFANQHTWTIGGENEGAASSSENDDDEFEIVDANGDSTTSKKRSKKRKRHTGKEAPNTLQRIEWFRIVLDEAHTIKEARTMQCKAVCNLSAQRRLSLTGTPVQNRLDDLFAQVRFLRLYPFTERSIWNEHCAQRRTKNSITSRTNANQNNEPLEQVALVKVQTIMKFLTLRRTKQSKTADGRPLLELPPKASHLVTLEFDQREQAAYKALHQKYKEDFEEMQAAGSVGTNYATILQEILVLRMACDHTGLVDASKDMKRLREGNTDISKAIAEDGLTRDRAARLFDIFCESSMADCATCGTDLSRFAEDSGGGGPSNDEADEASKDRPVVTRCQHFHCSTCFARAAGPKWNNPKTIKASDRVVCPSCSTEQGLLMDVIKLELSDIASVRSARQSPSPSVNEKGEEDIFDFGSDHDDDDDHKRVRNGKRKLISNNRFGADKDVPLDDRTGLSTKIRFLLGDLVPFSACNPKSFLYDADSPQLAHYAPTDEERTSSGITDSVCIAQTTEDLKQYRPVKSVVFSQWTTMLDQVANALHRAGIKAVRLDGKMKRHERAAALHAFKVDDGVEVFLISLRAGGFGLNLVNACRAYNIEPAWNPAVESQAMDRIHRMGQVRPVLVKKLIMKNTIEERMLDVQKRKEELANQVGEKRASSKSDERAERHKELSMLLSGDGSAGEPAQTNVST
ncbi:unnamed protein product [Sympodiomycopsis kandeliae]